MGEHGIGRKTYGAPRAKDHTNSQSPSASQSDLETDLIQPSSSAAEPVDIELLADLHQARAERLAEIKKQVLSGAYDSEDLLAAALERMLATWDGEELNDEEQE